METLNTYLDNLTENLDLVESDVDTRYDVISNIREGIKKLKRSLEREEYDIWLTVLEINLTFILEQIKKCNDIKSKLDNYISKLNKLLDNVKELNKETNNYYLSFGLQGQLKDQVVFDQINMDEQQRTEYENPIFSVPFTL